MLCFKGSVMKKKRFSLGKTWMDMWVATITVLKGVCEGYGYGSRNGDG
jgi:hypothetical protein